MIYDHILSIIAILRKYVKIEMVKENGYPIILAMLQQYIKVDIFSNHLIDNHQPQLFIPRKTSLPFINTFFPKNSFTYLIKDLKLSAEI